ncbi:MAG: nucleotidyl transferase AbiEii/AbiGii toxin family protein [Elstera sp.]
MFKRPHHQAIGAVLQALDADLLEQAACFFGGGTAITLLLGEYRESVDIDFLCASQDGYRLLRNRIIEEIAPIFIRSIQQVGHVRRDQYGIRTRVAIGASIIKFEIIREARIPLVGARPGVLGVPTLDPVSLYASKLLANADRGLDSSTLSRDAIDLAMMIRAWGAIPVQAWDVARAAYGDHLLTAFSASVTRLQDQGYVALCLKGMAMDPAEGPAIAEALGRQTLPS